MWPAAAGTGSRQTSPATHRTGSPTSGTISRSSRTVSGMWSLTTTGAKFDNVRGGYFKKATVPSGLFLGWTPPGVLLINFQVDGAYSSGGTIQG